MLKRRKEDGFTLIELMIVIAVIGILAVVLVPKVGTIKTQAKGAGIDTNVRMVQGYLQSKASNWASTGTTTSSDIAKKIATDFNNLGTSDKMANPFSAGTTVYDIVNSSGGNDLASNALIILIVGQSVPTEHKGAIVITLPTPSTNILNGNSSITIDGYDNAATPAIIKTVTVTP